MNSTLNWISLTLTQCSMHKWIKKKKKIFHEFFCFRNENVYNDDDWSIFNKQPDDWENNYYYEK